ncbi:hypothetical protein M1316_01195 [Candidatus Parvarchaeota archaeon]|nr:hypothetical protein [Candidatus Parvarchaeota archaeon]
MREARTLFEQLAAEFPAMAQTPFSPEELARRLNYYETVTKPLQNLMITGCYWGEVEHERVWAKCLEMITNLPREAGLDVWVRLRLYPSLVLLYSGGIAAIAAEQYGNFRSLLTKSKLIDERKSVPIVLGVNSEVIGTNVGRKIPGMEGHTRTPVSDYLYSLLREPFRESIPQDFLYQGYFDHFEYLSALVFVDMKNLEAGSEVWGPVGCFGWRRLYYREDTIMWKIDMEAAGAGGNWPPIKAGLFNGSVKRFKEVKVAFDSFLAKLHWY